MATASTTSRSSSGDLLFSPSPSLLFFFPNRPLPAGVFISTPHLLTPMGDRCHMTIYCRPQDTARFEDLGFTAQDTPESDGTIEMLDPEANYAHYGDLPDDIPWTGHHHEGGDYGPAELHCLGDGIVHEWECATSMRGGYVFPDPINDSTDFIHAIARFHEFHETRHQALKLLTCPPDPAPASNATSAA